jgi:hypothetical protein
MRIKHIDVHAAADGARISKSEFKMSDFHREANKAELPVRAAHKYRIFPGKETA